LSRHAYTIVEGREQLLGALAEAIDEIGLALASLSAAYEQLDIATADTLEEELFGPAQRAYGRAKRTHVEFAERHGMGRARLRAAVGRGSLDRVKGFIDHAVAAVRAAGGTRATLQDSPMLLEVGHV
jgi:hypothetical protein